MARKGKAEQGEAKQCKLVQGKSQQCQETYSTVKKAVGGKAKHSRGRRSKAEQSK